MKRFLVLLLVAVMGLSAAEAKVNKKDLKKQVKSYVKEGWVVPIGSAPIGDQITRSLEFQQALDDNGEPKYVIGEAMSIGENYDAAHFQAVELVKLDIAGRMASDVTALINNNVANKQLGEEQAASLVKTVAGGKSLISAKLGRIVELVNVYRKTKAKTVEVRMVCSYNYKNAMKAAHAAIREELEKESNELVGQLDKALGLK